MTTKPQKQGKGWEDEILEWYRSGKITQKQYRPIKSFISTELTKAKSETIQSVLACRPNHYKATEKDGQFAKTYIEGFNSALEEWTENINKLTQDENTKTVGH